MLERTRGRYRYIIPNLITLTSLLFGLVSMHAALEGQYETAAWFILYCTLLDKLDGTSARLLHATSDFGVELDSFADFTAFGLAPAFLAYRLLTDHGPFQVADKGLAYLQMSGVLFVLASVVRLARFNVSEGSARYMFGLATTASGGILGSLVLVGLKHADTAWAVGIMHKLPMLLFALAVFEVSNLRCPKYGVIRNKAFRYFVYFHTGAIPLLILLNQWPEYIFAVGFGTVAYSFVWAAVHRREVDADLRAEWAAAKAPGVENDSTGDLSPASDAATAAAPRH